MNFRFNHDDLHTLPSDEDFEGSKRQTGEDQSYDPLDGEGNAEDLKMPAIPAKVDITEEVKLDWEKPFEEWDGAQLLQGMYKLHGCNNELYRQLSSMQEVNTSLTQKLKGTGKSDKSEINKGEEIELKKILKLVMWRKIKMVNSSEKEEVDAFLKPIYDIYTRTHGFVDGNDKFPYIEFKRVYGSTLLKYQSSLRSDTQNACLKAMYGACFRIDTDSSLA